MFVFGRNSVGFHVMGGHRKIIAVVEDDASMLKGVDRLLSVHGFGTELYDSAEAYLGGAAASGAACLVVDIHLGGMSGLDLSHRLTASGSKVPVIFMTAMDDEETRRTATRAGCIAYLRKPFPAHLLIDAIRRSAGPAA